MLPIFMQFRASGMEPRTPCQCKGEAEFVVGAGGLTTAAWRDNRPPHPIRHSP